MGATDGGASRRIIETAALGETVNLWPLFWRCASGVIYLPGYTLGWLIRKSGFQLITVYNGNDSVEAGDS